MPTADLGEVRINYELGGVEDGPRVMYVSGSGSDLRRHPNAFDTSLPGACRVLAYDHRGLGQSSAGIRRPEMADFAADLLGLLDHVGWDSCRMLGVSFGGMVAQEAAVTEPGRFERVALACTSPGGAGGASYPLHELVDLAPAERLRIRVEILDTRTLDNAGLRNALTTFMEGLGDVPATDGERAQLIARSRHDVWDRLGQMTMPVLIAAGRYDGIAVPENQKALLSRLPNAELRWYEGGHAFFVQDPDADPALTTWLST
jgi:3-oxoadipate enol-lactonase